MNVLRPPDEDNRYGGIIDDFKSAIEWQPILPLLRRFQNAMTPASKMSAAIDIAEFIAKVGFGDDSPQQRRWSKIARRFAVAVSFDPDLRELLKEMVK